MTEEYKSDITLILATSARTKEVADFFSSIRSTPKTIRLQIVIADQNDDDRLKPIVAALPDHWEVEHVKSSVKGVSAARNEVLSRIASPVVAFPDDDCVYEEGAIERALEVFRSDPSLDVILGVWRGFGEKFASKEFQKKIGRYSLFKKGEMFVQFYRSRIVEKVGLFDENFGPGPSSRYPFGGDDSDYLARACLLGANIARTSLVKIRHPLQDMNAVSETKIRGYGVARMALLRKLRYPLWFRFANVMYPLARMILNPRAFRYFRAMFLGRCKIFPQFPVPCSQFPVPSSQFPVPCSQFPVTP